MMAKRQNNLADEIRAAVRASGMMQKDVARALGISDPTLSKFLAGKCWLAESTANKIADLFDLHIVAGPRAKVKAKTQAGKAGGRQ